MDPMVYLTQLIYLRDGHEEAFQRFEDIVLPLLGKYRGELLVRLRPDKAAMIGGSSEAPYEVHIVRFESEADLASYSADEVRQRHLALKEESVRSVLVIKGSASP